MTGYTDPVRQFRLRDLGPSLSVFVRFRDRGEYTSQPFFAGIQEIIGEVLLHSYSELDQGSNKGVTVINVFMEHVQHCVGINSHRANIGYSNCMIQTPMPIWSESLYAESYETPVTYLTKFVLFPSMARLASCCAIRSHRIPCLTPAPGDSTIVLAFISTGGDVSHPDEISSTVGDASVG